MGIAVHFTSTLRLPRLALGHVPTVLLLLGMALALLSPSDLRVSTVGDVAPQADAAVLEASSATSLSAALPAGGSGSTVKHPRVSQPGLVASSLVLRSGFLLAPCPRATAARPRGMATPLRC